MNKEIKRASSKNNIIETEVAIKFIKDVFERELARNLNLTRVSAPLFVFPESGLNDNLNGVERPVAFDVLDIGKNVEVVHSLAKWKRMALAKYGFAEGEGLYTDMNAIRRTFLRKTNRNTAFKLPCRHGGLYPSGNKRQGAHLRQKAH